jgi:hypothetical protein
MGWSTPRPGRFTHRERPGTHFVGGRAGLDGAENLASLPGFVPRTVQPVASRYTDYVIPAHPPVLHTNSFFLHRPLAD